MTEVFRPENIKRIAKEKKITQATLALAVGADRSTLNRWLKGKHGMNTRYLTKIAWALGCKVADFFDVVPDAAPGE